LATSVYIVIQVPENATAEAEGIKYI